MLCSIDEFKKKGYIPASPLVRQYIDSPQQEKEKQCFSDGHFLMFNFEQMRLKDLLTLLAYCEFKLVPMTIYRGNKMVDGKTLGAIINHYFHKKLYRASDQREMYSQSTINQLSVQEQYQLNQIMARLIFAGKVKNWGIITNDKYGFVDLDVGDHHANKEARVPLLDLALITRCFVYNEATDRKGGIEDDWSGGKVTAKMMMYFFPSKHGVRILFNNKYKQLKQGVNKEVLVYPDLNNNEVRLNGDVRVGNSLVMLSYYDQHQQQWYKPAFACYGTNASWINASSASDDLVFEYPWRYRFAVTAHDFRHPDKPIIDYNHAPGVKNTLAPAPRLNPVKYRTKFCITETLAKINNFHVTSQALIDDYRRNHQRFVAGCQADKHACVTNQEEVADMRKRIRKAIKHTKPATQQKHHSTKYQPTEETLTLVTAGVLNQVKCFTHLSELAWAQGRRQPYDFIHQVTGKRRYNIFMQIVRLFCTRTKLTATEIEKLINQQAQAIELDISDIDLHSIVKVYEQAKNNGMTLVPSNIDLAAFKALWGRALAVDLTTINAVLGRKQKAIERFDTLKGGFTLKALAHVKHNDPNYRCRWLLDEVNWFNNRHGVNYYGPKYENPACLNINQDVMFRMVSYTPNELRAKQVTTKEWKQAKQKAGLKYNVMNPLMNKDGLRKIKAQIVHIVFKGRIADPADPLTAPAKNGRGIDEWWAKHINVISKKEAQEAEEDFMWAVKMRNKIFANKEANRTLPKRIDVLLQRDPQFGFGFKMSFRLDVNDFNKLAYIEKYVDEEYYSSMTLTQFDFNIFKPLQTLGVYRLIRRSPLRTNDYSNGRISLTLPGGERYAYMYGGNNRVRTKYPRVLPNPHNPKYNNAQGEQLYHIDRERFFTAQYVNSRTSMLVSVRSNKKGKKRLWLSKCKNYRQLLKERYNFEYIKHLSYPELWGCLFELGLILKSVKAPEAVIFSILRSVVIIKNEHNQEFDNLPKEWWRDWRKHSRFMHLLNLFTDGNEVPVVPTTHIEKINTLFTYPLFSRKTLQAFLEKCLTPEEMQHFVMRNVNYTEQLNDNWQRLAVTDLQAFNVANEEGKKVRQYLAGNSTEELTPEEGQAQLIMHYRNQVTHVTEADLEELTLDEKQAYLATDIKQPQYLKQIFNTAVDYREANKPVVKTQTAKPKATTELPKLTNGNTKQNAQQFIESDCEQIPTGIRNHYLVLLCSVALRAGYDVEEASALITPAFLKHIDNSDGEYSQRQVKATLQSLISSQQQNNYKYAGVALNQDNFGDLMKRYYVNNGYDANFDWLFSGAGFRPAKSMKELKRLPLSERIRLSFKAFNRIIDKNADQQMLLTNVFIGNYNHLVYNEQQELNGYKRATLLKTIETLTSKLNAYDIYTIMQQQLPHIKTVLNSGKEQLSQNFDSRQDLIQAVFFCQKFINGFEKTSNPCRHSTAYRELLNRVNSSKHKQKHAQAIKGSFFDYLPLNAFLLSLKYEIKRADNYHLVIKRKGLDWYLTFLQKAQMQDVITITQQSKQAYRKGVKTTVPTQKNEINRRLNNMLDNQDEIDLSTINTG